MQPVCTTCKYYPENIRSLGRGPMCNSCGTNYRNHAPVEFDEERIDVIGPNGNDGLHYIDNTAGGFLRRAAEIMAERGKQYDQEGGERSMGKTVTMFNACTGHNLTEAEGWLLMECLKNVRQWQRPGFHQDSADDGVAYAALKAEALARGSHDAADKGRA